MSTSGVLLLMEHLFDQEVFHHKLLKVWFEQTDLARRLGLWAAEVNPQVESEPDKGIFDLKLHHPKAAERTLIELKVNAFLSDEQAEAQREYAESHKAARAYIFLGPTYFCWRAVMQRSSPRIALVGPVELMSGLQDLYGQINEEARPGLRSISDQYTSRLARLVTAWQAPYPAKIEPSWLRADLNTFRLLDDIGSHWPSPAAVYKVAHSGGYDRILSPRSQSTRERHFVNGSGPFRVSWEIVSERVRFKVHVQDEDHRGPLRELCREALTSAAKALGVPIEVTGRMGEHMTLAQLVRDPFEGLIQDGQVGAQRARELYTQCEQLLGALVTRLPAQRPAPAAG